MGRINRKQLAARKPLSLLHEEMKGENRLKRVLGPVGLTSLGIGAIIGTGIFVLIGKAAGQMAGPAVMVSFIVAGLACAFAGLCYAEFASMVPVAGSAYTYAYATLGELCAWIIGWDLVLEYAVAASAVATGWSAYFQELLRMFGLGWPKVIGMAPFDYSQETGGTYWTGALLDLPALLITAAFTVVLVLGIRESARFNATLVVIKVAIVLFVIVAGAFYVNPENWSNFAPYGWTGLSFFGHTALGQSDAGGKPLGMLAGSAIIFFSYIGFDSVSTQSEEARNPQRDIPIAIVGSLLFCSLLYVLVAAVLTGMVRYDQIDVKAPISDAFAQKGLWWADGLISVGALTGISSVLLVLLLSQPRVLLAMARDGLLPTGFFASVHERFRTPWKATILTGCLVGLMAGFVPLNILAELVSIGTLFAFVVVCSAVLVMRKTYPDAERPFRAPLVPLTPILGILTCLTLMFSLPGENWLRLVGWLAIGLVIYFTYGRHHSTLTSHPEWALAASGINQPAEEHVEADRVDERL
jgi:APA family basic amino acid/polyamine antiporter